MTLPLWQQVPKRGERPKHTSELVLSTAAGAGIASKEVRPLRSGRKVEAEISRRGIGRTLILANVRLARSTKTSLQPVLGLDQSGDHVVVGAAVEGDGPHHSSLGLAQELRNAAHRGLLLSLPMERATNSGVGRNGTGHANLRSSEVHVLRNSPQRVDLSSLDRRREHRLNKRHDEGGMRVVAPLLKAGKTDIVPEIMRNIQLLLGI